MRALPEFRPLAVVWLSALLAVSPAWGQPVTPVTLEALLDRVGNDPNPHPYTMTADFAADFTLRTLTGTFVVRAGGSLVESRTTDGPRRRRATVTRLDVPVLLRPFTSAIRKAVTDLIETEVRPAEVIPHMDVFLVEERPPRYLLGGVRSDIVTETMNRYGQQALVRDAAVRRQIARWLWAPSQRTAIVRPGPGPYLLTATVDETGLVHQVSLAYDWGQVGNRILFVTVAGRPFWQEVTSDSSSEVAGLGRVDGLMVLRVTNHCVNCASR
jgi:hypothetical protein